MPYTPSHVLHKDRRVGGKAEGNTIDGFHILCKSGQPKALIHLFVKMIQPGPHRLFGEHKWPRSIIEHIVFFTERAREREGQAMEKSAPESFLFMGQTDHGQPNSLRGEMKKLPQGGAPY
jgi:hypothetical protein